jgi:hypothetical protein
MTIQLIVTNEAGRRQRAKVLKHLWCEARNVINRELSDGLVSSAVTGKGFDPWTLAKHARFAE